MRTRPPAAAARSPLPILRLTSARPFAWALGVAAALSLGALAPTSALAERIDAASRVAAATIYPTGASVTRVARFDAPAGRHEIVLDDLPLRIDADSLRVSGGDGGGAFAIEGVSHRIDVDAPPPLPEGERERLFDEIRALEWDRRAAEDQIVRATDRREYMAALRRATTSTPSGRDGQAPRPQLLDDVASWSDAWALIDAEVAAADADARAAGARLEEIDDALSELRAALSAAPPSAPRAIATVSIDADAPISNGRIEITYLTEEARWSPLYDLRLDAAPSIEASDDATPRRRLSIVRRAAISQATGEDWSSVRLALSTARPTGELAAAPPPIRQAALREAPILAGATVGRRAYDSAVSEPAIALEAEEAYAEVDGAPITPGLAPSPPPPPRVARELDALVSYDGETVVYALPQPVDAPGDGEVRQVRIDSNEAEVDLELRATPSVDPTVYLYALFDNGPAALPPGSAALYRDGVYLGRVDLGYVGPGASAALPFGPFESVSARRDIVRTLEGDEGVFRVSTRRRSRFRLIAANNGDADVRLKLFDALPFTETNQIEIKLVATPAPSERDVEGRRGALMWEIELAPGEEETIGFGYDLSWPEGVEIELR